MQDLSCVEDCAATRAKHSRKEWGFAAQLEQHAFTGYSLYVSISILQKIWTDSVPWIVSLVVELGLLKLRKSDFIQACHQRFSMTRMLNDRIEVQSCSLNLVCLATLAPQKEELLELSKAKSMYFQYCSVDDSSPTVIDQKLVRRIGYS